jgi:hypothetical protein
LGATVTGFGVTVMVAIGPTTIVPLLSLQAPKVFGAGDCQIPVASSWSDHTGDVAASGELPVSLTPMSVDVLPAAGPLAATKLPSYERNSTTVPLGSTRAIPSGSGLEEEPPFWMPFVA